MKTKPPEFPFPKPWYHGVLHLKKNTTFTIHSQPKTRKLQTSIKLKDFNYLFLHTSPIKNMNAGMENYYENWKLKLKTEYYSHMEVFPQKWCSKLLQSPRNVEFILSIGFHPNISITIDHKYIEETNYKNKIKQLIFNITKKTLNTN